MSRALRRGFVLSTGEKWPRDHPVDAIGFLAYLTPFRAAKLTDSRIGDAIKVQLSVDPTDVVAAGFDPHNRRYLPHSYINSPEVTSNVEGMVARRAYVIEGVAASPFHELFTDLADDTYADCEDPNNGFPAWCTMTIVHHGVKRIGVRSRFSVVVGVGLPRRLLPHWREIRSEVLGFVAQRAILVPFGSTSENEANIEIDRLPKIENR